MQSVKDFVISFYQCFVKKIIRRYLVISELSMNFRYLITNVIFIAKISRKHL